MVTTIARGLLATCTGPESHSGSRSACGSRVVTNDPSSSSVSKTTGTLSTDGSRSMPP